MSNISTLLARLEAVRQTTTGKWLARCPAHEDHDPSLSIRLTDDGVVLLHCFAGCEVSAILGAVGLTPTDLFPPKIPTGTPVSAWQRPSLTASDLATLLREPLTTVFLFSCDRERFALAHTGDHRALQDAIAAIHQLLDAIP